MKTAISFCLALMALSSAQAQMFRPEAGSRGPRVAVNGGGERNDRGERGDRGRAPVRVGVGYSPGYYGSGYGYGRYGYDGRRGYSWSVGYDWPRYRYSYAPVYSYSYYPGYGAGYPYYDMGYYGSGSGAANGLLLGALAGGIIGHNSGDFRHNGWRGAAWGAGVGWLLGSIVDANRRVVGYQPAPTVMAQPAAVVPVQQAQPAAQPQPVTIINNYYNSSTPMSSANGLFGR